MSLGFIVQEVESYEGIPEGQYTAQVDHIELVNGDYGDYYVVKWKIISPSEFEGRFHQERYMIGSENEDVKRIAISNFSRFCMEIGGLQKGDNCNEEDFLFKIATILIRKSVSKKDGRTYSNVVKMELVNGSAKSKSTSAPSPSPSPSMPTGEAYDAEKTAAVLALAGIQLPTTPQADSKPLNDEVPF